MPGTPLRDAACLIEIVDAVQCGLLVVDSATRSILDVNATALRMFGAKREEVVGARCSRFFRVPPGEDCPGDGSCGTDLVSERVLLAPDGVPFPILKRVVPMQLGDRAVLVESFVDLTELLSAEAARHVRMSERQLAQRALMASESKASAILRETPSLIVITSLETGRLVEVNDAFVRFSGYTREEAVGSHGASLNLFENDADRVGILDAVRRHQTIRNQEVVYRNRAGDRMIGPTSAVQVDFGQGPCVLAAVTDVTERKRADETLRESEARFRTVVQTTQDGFWVVDDSARFLDVNEGYCRIIGYTREELLRMTVADVEAVEDVDRVRKHLARIVEQGSDSFETRHRCKDGSLIDVEVSARHLPWWGGRTFAFMRNITDRKRVEAALREAKREEDAANERTRHINRRLQEAIARARGLAAAAEAANIAKSQFLANMSHEIRTPMNAIIGMTELVLDTQLSTEQREHLEVVRGSATALLRLLNDILDFSKIEAGKIELDATPFSLRALLSDTVDALQLEASRKSLALSWHVEESVPDVRVGDAGRLGQVLTNLTSNAIKFTEQGGVRIEVSHSVDPDASGHVHFAVIDTGVGIAEDKKGIIFDMFAQADASTTRRYGGTGLGLAISRRLVEMMGGALDVESEMGKGSTFHFALCLDAASGMAGGTSEEPDEGQTSYGRVLVVGDPPLGRRQLEMMLRSWALEPVIVASAEQAWSELERSAQEPIPYRLLLTSTELPEMSGVALAERLRKHHGKNSPVIILLASTSDRIDQEQCKHLGIATCLTRPVAQSELFGAILIALRAPLRPSRASSAHPSLEASWVAGTKLNVLVAEDNEVNGRVISMLLERQGHSVVLVGDGSAAVQALEACPFDLVLMDVQMPTLDGFQATAEIRRREQQRGGHVPILALTAHAMKGDRERCLRSGMDGYVAKPILAAELARAVQEVVAATRHASSLEGEASRSRTSAQPAPVLDRAHLLEKLEGDEELLASAIDVFLETQTGMLDSVASAAQANDARSLERAAHALKSAVGNFHVGPAFQSAHRLEMLGRSGDLAEIEAAVADLQHQVRQLGDTLARIRGEVPS
ncbi:MAG: PAS domain S-box protein [Deltaproteobacteria bacterium]|nr:PAS domain S-box protein [Deltaproteobacteria bacterium]